MYQPVTTRQQQPQRTPLYKRVFFSIYSYTIIYALFGVLSLSYHACFNSSLSTLEKRYHFSSSTGGLIMITDNIATVLTNLFIGYYGKTAHKPRWMSIGCVVTGLSVMITALPYFIYGQTNQVDLNSHGGNTTNTLSTFKGIGSNSSSNDNNQLCFTQSIKQECHGELFDSGRTMTMVAVACFGISNFFRGFGTSIYFTYGTPYLDDNVSKAKMPTFFAFIFAARIFGAPIGFYLSSLALKYYENPFSPPPGLTPNDPRWIGAWWIGFLVSGFLMLLLAIPLSLFPREFRRSKPKSEDIEVANLTLGAQPAIAPADKTKASMLPDSSQFIKPSTTGTMDSNNYGWKVDEPETSKQTLKEDTTSRAEADRAQRKREQDLSLKELPGEVYAIITNPIIVCQMMGNLFRGIGIIGYFVFQSKYLEAQFRQSASKASLVSGTTGFLAKIFGVLFGGLLITLIRPKPRILTSYIFVVELTSVFTLLYGASVLGPQYAYPMTKELPTGQLDLKNTCNSQCFCDQVRYQPVCDIAAKKSYFSPCHAGCKDTFKLAGNNGYVYTQCDCIEEGGANTLEKCPPDTDNLLRYATIVAVGGMISGSSRSGNMVTFFRSINPDQKSLAVAVGSFWHSLMVSIPYPIIYGKIFDFSCLVWSKECNNERGNCWLYDTEKLRYVYHAVSIALIAMGSVFDLIMIFLSPRLGNLYDDLDNVKRSTIRERLMFWKRNYKPSNKPSQTQATTSGHDRKSNNNNNSNNSNNNNNNNDDNQNPNQQQESSQRLHITRL